MDLLLCLLIVAAVEEDMGEASVPQFKTNGCTCCNSSSYRSHATTTTPTPITMTTLTKSDNENCPQLSEWNVCLEVIVEWVEMMCYKNWATMGSAPRSITHPSTHAPFATRQQLFKVTDCERVCVGMRVYVCVRGCLQLPWYYFCFSGRI